MAKSGAEYAADHRKAPAYFTRLDCPLEVHTSQLDETHERESQPDDV
ncbi:MAG: hypothetical protein P8X64_09845 [Anaerolineales bacterium]